MSELGPYLRRRMLRRRHRLVRIGWVAATYAKRNDSMAGLGIGLGMIALGLLKGNKAAKPIYKTSIDVGQGATIVVKQGKRPIARTAPIGQGN